MLPPKKEPNPRLLADYLEQSARLQKRAWIFTAIPLIVLAFTFWWAAKYLADLQRQVRVAEAQLLTTDKAVDSDKGQLAELEGRLKNARTTAAVCGSAVVYATDSQAAVTQAAYKRAASNFPSVALVTIQVASKSQLPKANEIAASLRKSGYEVPPDQAIDIRGTHISRGSYLRYFYREDRPLGEKILQVINGLGVSAKLYDLSDAKDVGETHPHQFEFRLGLDSIPPDTDRKGNAKQAD
jgi:hypothetical protein